MTSRRSLLAGFIGLAGLSLLACILSDRAAAGGEAVADETARSLNRADAVFSQRPQLYYNRKRQLRRQSHTRPERPPRVNLRRSRGRLRPAQQTTPQ